ncbi:pilus assembly protein TadG-related protein [Rhizobium sp. SIMBA_035]
MSPKSHFLSHVTRLLHDRSGNFGIFTAILVPILIGSAGVAIDVSNMVASQRQLQEASDSAALAAASALADGKVADAAAAQQLAKDFVAGQMANYLSASDAAYLKNNVTVNVVTTTTATGKSYKVNVSAAYNMGLTPLMSVFGKKSVSLASNSATTSGTNDTKTALSMELVLDQSGSMGYDTTTCAKYKSDNKTCKTYVIKIDALKAAAGKLFDALDKADPQHALVRTGVVSYNNGILRDSSNKIIGVSPMNWGTSVGRTYVSTLQATGGTDATEPVQVSTAAIQKSTDGSDAESKEHVKKGNTTVDRYIVLMTDGEMTGNSSTWNSTKDKNVRDACDASKKAGVQIFTVAFMAPDKGKSLLQYCASSSNTYFEAETMEDLVDDFDSIAQTATRALTLLTN